MTGKHLPPTNAREISALKRRVSDLERMLDRLRRGTAPTSSVVTLPPFASINDTARFSSGSAASGWDPGLAFYASNEVETPDPSGTIRIDADLSATFYVLGPGWFEFGMTVRFREEAGSGARGIGVAQLDLDPIERLEIAIVARAPGVETVLSGSRVVWCDQSRFTVWYGQDSGADMDVLTETYWVRQVSRSPNTEPVGSA